MRKDLFGAVGVVIILAIIAFGFFRSVAQRGSSASVPTTTGAPTAIAVVVTVTPAPVLVASSTPMVVSSPIVVALPPRATSTPPLARVPFPSQTISFPATWPNELRYPNQFDLVETSDSQLAAGPHLWAAKLRFHGVPGNAADALAGFFQNGGWAIVQRSPLDAGGIVMLIRRENPKRTGDLVIDVDTQKPGQTRIVATVFL